MALHVRIEGLSKLSRELNKVATGLPSQLKTASRPAAQIVADEAKRLVPRRTGHLASTIHVETTGGGAEVRVAARYAGVIHNGWPEHNIEPNPFLYDAADNKRDDVVDRYDKAVDEQIAKSVHRGTGGVP